jgi:hypothetical protein
VHGIENFVGNALQCYFLDKLMNLIDENTGLLFIHDVNPFGCKYLRRYSEANIDMNRNFDIDNKLFLNRNDLYSQINSILNPVCKHTTSWRNDINFYINIISIMYKFGVKALRQAIPQGQYKHQAGIFFGGFDFEPQVLEFRKILPSMLIDYNYVMSIDLHTGVGTNYNMHIIEIPQRYMDLDRTLFTKIFDGFTLEGTDSLIHKETGSYLEFIFSLLQKHVKYIPILIDFGTLNSNNLWGALKSLKLTIDENQFYHYGCKKQKDELLLKKNILNMFYPSNIKWRQCAVSNFENFLNICVNRFKEYCI